MWRAGDCEGPLLTLLVQHSWFPSASLLPRALRAAPAQLMLTNTRPPRRAVVRRFRRKKVAQLRLQTGNWSLSEYAGDEIDEVDDDTDLEDGRH